MELINNYKLLSKGKSSNRHSGTYSKCSRIRIKAICASQNKKMPIIKSYLTHIQSLTAPKRIR